MCMKIMNYLIMVSTNMNIQYFSLNQREKSWMLIDVSVWSTYGSIILIFIFLMANVFESGIYISSMLSFPHTLIFTHTSHTLSVYKALIILVSFQSRRSYLRI